MSRGEGLGGARVALLEGRMGPELADLVRRHGGVPVRAEAVREVPLDAATEVEALIDRLTDGRVRTVVLLTGVGVDALFAEAQRLHRAPDLEARLRLARTICRGPKPRAALRRRGLAASVTVGEPYTTDEVIACLDGIDATTDGVAIVHHGERNRSLSDAIASRGGRVVDLCLYEWRLPEDTAPLGALIDEIIAGRIDAMAITSQVQVRHLLELAARGDRSPALVEALNFRAVVAAVGPTCARALESAGITPDVVPPHPSMGAMVVALAERLSSRR